MPVADLLKTGAVIAAGTDYPAADSVDPLDTLYSMTTRRGVDGKPEGGWYPEHRVDVMTALRAMTWAPAYAAFEEADRGTLTVGRLADMTVLSADPRTMAPDDLQQLEVRMTVVGGVPVSGAGSGRDRSRASSYPRAHDRNLPTIVAAENGAAVRLAAIRRADQ
jgi:predicted amidohydrolase YtcJ